MMFPKLKRVRRTSGWRANRGRIEAAFFDCFAPGRYTDPDSPSVSYTMELTRHNGGDLEVYFTSPTTPVPIFVGYARGLGGREYLERLHDEAMAYTPMEDGR